MGQRNILSPLLLMIPGMLAALPQEISVHSGSAQISQPDNQALQVIASDKAILDYKSFDIGHEERVQFIQPSTQASVLNRVRGEKPSEIFGKLSSNGKVFLVNPNGIYFGPNAKVDTGSLIASVLHIDPQDFLDDKYLFRLVPGSEENRIDVLGEISASDGSVVLLAPKIRNDGLITASFGKVILGSAEEAVLDFSGDGLIGFSLDGALKKGMIEAAGAIEASEVFLSLKMASQVIESVVNTDGIEFGSEIVEIDGKIEILSESLIQARNIVLDGDGSVRVAGTLDAASLHESGGTVKVLGDSIFLEGALIDASGDLGGGTVLIGGDYKGEGSTRTAITNSIDNGSTILSNAYTSGDGGKVIVWADGITRFDGKIFAQGGSQNGNGGFVETSGRQSLAISEGHVNAMAPKGKAGSWLLDPNTITVAIGGLCTLVQAADCTDMASACSIAPATINASGANVVLCASSTITVVNAISIAGAGIGITFQAGAGTTLQSAITTNGGDIAFSGGALNDVALNAGVTLTTGAGAGDILFAGKVLPSIISGITFSAGTGSVTITGAYENSAMTTGPLTISGANVTLSNIGTATDLGASTVSIVASNTITLNGDYYRATNITFRSANTGGAFNIGINPSLATAVFNATNNIIFDTVTGGGTGSVLLSLGKDLSVTAAGIYFTNFSGVGTLFSPIRGTGMNHNLTLTASTGAGIIELGNIGSMGGMEFATASLTASGNIFLRGDIYSSAITISSPVAIQLGGSLYTDSTPISIPNGVTLATYTGGPATTNSFVSTVNSGAGADITLGTIGVFSGTRNLTLTAGTGTVLLNNAASGLTSFTASGAIVDQRALVSITGPISYTATTPATGIRLFDNIITANTAITLTGDVQSRASTPISISSGAGAGDITFGNTIDGDVIGKALTITGGTGTVTVPGAIGAVNRLGNLTITGATISFADIGTMAAAGASAITVTARDTINLNGNFTRCTGAATYRNATSGGAFNININPPGALSTVSSTGGQIIFDTVTNGGTGSVLLAAGKNFSVTGTNVFFTNFSGAFSILFSPIRGTGMGHTLSLATTGAGTIEFGRVGSMGGGEFANVNLTTTGSSLIRGDVYTDAISISGGSVRLAAGIYTSSTPILIPAALVIDNFTGGSATTNAVLDTTFSGAGASVTVSTTLNADSAANTRNLSVVSGTGTILFTGAIGNTQALGSLSATGTVVRQNSTAAITGALTYTSPTANTGIQLAGASITTTNSNITFNGDVSLQAATVTLSTGAGAGNISFLPNAPATGLIDGNAAGRNLTLTAGTGNIIVSSTAGATNRLGTFTISSAFDVTTNGIRANTITQTTGTGTSTFGGVGNSLDTSLVGGISLTGTVITINSPVVTAAGGPMTITNSGTLTIPSSAPITLDGPFNQNGLAGVFLGANITTTNDNVSVLRTTTLTAPVTINTGAGAGSITFSSNIRGGVGYDLTLTAGTGNISLFGPVGFVTRLGVLTITNGATILIGQTTAASITQLSGSATTTFSGAIDTNTAPGISVIGTNVTFSAPVNTTAGGPVTVTNSGTLTINLASTMTLDGPFTQNGAGPVTLAGSISTTNDAISILRAVTLSGSTVLTTQTTPGAAGITFSNVIDGAGDLTLTTDTGMISFGGNIGGTTRIGNLVINTASTVTAPQVRAATITQNGTGSATFTGTVDTNAAGGVSLTGGAFTFNNTVTTTSAGPVTITNSGLLSIAAAADMTLDGAFTQNGAGLVSTAGDITTTNDDITFLRAVTLTGSAAFSTGAGAGNIIFQNTINGTVANAENLTLSSGTGDITLSGIVGGGTRVGTFLIGNANNVTTSAITAGSITQTTGSGTTTFGGALDTNTAAGINLAGTNFVLNGAATTTAAGVVTIANSGSLTINTTAPINAAGAFTQTIGPVFLGANVTTANANLSFGGAVSLIPPAVSPIALNSGGGNILFSSTITGGQDLSLTAGLGNVTLTGAAGTPTRLGVLTINSAADVTTAAITAASITQAAGTGTTTFNGALDTNTVSGIAITGTNVTFSAPVNTTAAGPVTVTNSGTLTINLASTMTLDGPFTQNGAGPVTLAGSIATTNDTISFLRAVTLSGATVLTTQTTPGAAGITFSSTIDGGGNLTLTTDTGMISFGGNIGGTTRIGNLVINTASLVTAPFVRAATITQTGTGSATFTSNVDTDALGGINLTGVNFSFAAPVTTTLGSNGPFTVNHSGTLTIPSGANVFADGGFLQTTMSGTQLGANITTRNQNVSFSGPISLTAASAIDVTNGAMTGAGRVLFGAASTVDNNFPFSVTGGDTGTALLPDVVFLAPLGGMSALGSLNVHGGFIDQNAFVLSNGTVTYGSTLLLSANITTIGSDITINSDVIRDTVPLVTVTSGLGAGNIVFNGTIDGDVAGRDLTVQAGTGTASLNGTVGSNVPLGNLIVNGSTVFLFNIGGALSGAATVAANSTSNINLTGTLYTADAQIYTAPGNLNVSGGFPTVITTFLNSNLFNLGGVIQLTNGSDFTILINNLDFILPTVYGTSIENLSVSTGSGTITIGKVGLAAGEIGQVTADGEQITFTNAILAHGVDFVSNTTIKNNPMGPHLISLTGDGSFNGLNGNVGVLGNEISVSALGQIFAGANGPFPSRADFIGSTGDGTIHEIPTNPPCIITLNGIEITSCFTPPAPTPPTPKEIIELIPNTYFFVPSIYAPVYTLADYVYFLEDRADDLIADRRPSLLYWIPNKKGGFRR
ncbi:MAG: filamentous hemagglutinin N-terminal domain-containing protein [Parachlamydiales bacterium]|nr:filamentous hemagglutinin N-terminal domain-containing protein [Parachlamydiales bacterium]